ncbi:glycosyltransferase family 4 protein [Halomarina litorea]|uniref:glycosyltransferase family 4 protein n=1 Tax=Halomarina litorea TaxID=2961595 RepID=UPI0020C493BD|nr:glycosyltransferase family 4 protein [Halomarina sp. BCD28]
MRIAYVYDAVYPWETGGVQKRVWELARRLAPDHDVHWYGLKYWDGPDVIEREGVTLHGVATPPPLYAGGRRSIPEALTFAARLLRPLCRESFDVVDCQEFPYFPAFAGKANAALTGTTLLLTWHEVWADYWYEYLGRRGALGRLVERATARLPDAHLAVSDRTRRDVMGLGVGDVTLLPNGVSREEVAAAPPSSDSVDVLFVGRLIPEKNASLLVRAVDRMCERRPDVRCTILGEGPEAPALEALVDRLDLGGNVTVRPPLERYEDVLGLMKAAEVVAAPSVREGFGMVVLEALACGTPVATVSHPQNAAEELVADGVSGAVCRPSPDAFARAIERAAVCSPRDCRAVARPYEWDRLADRAEALYAEVA